MMFSWSWALRLVFWEGNDTKAYVENELASGATAKWLNKQQALLLKC